MLVHVISLRFFFTLSWTTVQNKLFLQFYLRLRVNYFSSLLLVAIEIINHHHLVPIILLLHLNYYHYYLLRQHNKKRRKKPPSDVNISLWVPFPRWFHSSNGVVNCNFASTAVRIQNIKRLWRHNARAFFSRKESDDQDDVK